MESYTERTNRLIKEIKTISSNYHTKVSEYVRLLAYHVEAGITETRPDMIAKMRRILGYDNVGYSDIALFIWKWNEQEQFMNLNRDTFYSALDKKYKREKIHEEKTITEKLDLESMTLEQKSQIYDYLRPTVESVRKPPARDIVSRFTTEKEIEEALFECEIAEELRKFFLKILQQHKDGAHDPALCKKIGVELKTVRDGRFLSDIKRMEALLVASGTVTSLNNVVDGEQYVLSYWDVKDNTENCRECNDKERCGREKCNHICHAVVKKGTTKGFNYAKNTNKDLKSLHEHISALQGQMPLDLCYFGKVLLDNKHLDKFANNYDKMRIIDQHIEITDCQRCREFLDKNPTFFDVAR